MGWGAVGVGRGVVEVGLEGASCELGKGRARQSVERAKAHSVGIARYRSESAGLANCVTAIQHESVYTHTRGGNIRGLLA